MTDGGQLRLHIVRDAESIVAASVRSTRPAAARLLVGRPLDEALALVPRLFSLCGRAQGAAARLAGAAARGEDWQAAGEALGQEVALEAIGEHLWRLLLDWPRQLGLPVRRDDFLHWRQRLLLAGKAGDTAAASTSSATSDFAGALTIWLKDDALCWPADLAERWPSAPPAALLPWGNAAAWAQTDFDALFSAQPTHAGLAAETGALARQAGQPAIAAALAAGRHIAARILARQADLVRLAETLSRGQSPGGWLDAASPEPGVGVARVETARGLLLHMTQVNDGRVGRYVIVAPTEWNFHPQGAFVRETVGMTATSHEAAALFAGQLALSLDPCVTFEVLVENA